MRRAGNRDGRPASHPWHLYPLGAIAVVIVVLAITQIGPDTSTARTARETVTAENGVVQSTVTGSGNVEAGSDLSVNFQTGGTLQHVYVQQGQHVYAGQLLAALDPTAADLTLDQAHRNLTAAEDQLGAARATASSSSSSTSSSAGTATGASLDTTGASARLTTEARIVRFAATTTVTTPAPPPATTTSPSTRTTTTASAPATRTTPVVTTRRTTSAARSVSSGSASTNGASTSSGAGAASTTTNPVASADSAGASVATALANLDSAEANLRTAEIGVNNTRLYAPVSGTLVSLSSAVPGDSVSSGSTTSGASSASSSSASGAGSSTSAGSLGGSGASSSSGSSASSSSSSGSGFAEIVDTSSLSMTVALSESDISKVHVGQPATVTLDALSGVELAARVSQIASVGTTSSSVVSYDVTLTLEQHDGRVKPGMSASAAVIVGSAQGLTVPNAAVSGTGNVGAVNLLRGDGTVSQPVVVGVRGDSRTQIISGLRAGQQLVVTTTLPSLSSTASSSSGSTGTLGGTSRRSGGFGASGFGATGGFGAGGGGPPAGP